MSDLDAVSLSVSEVFIKEEPESYECSESNAEESSDVHPGPSKNLSEMQSIMKHVENGHISAVSESDEDQLSSIISDDEDNCDESYAAFNVEAQLGNLSSSSGLENDSFELLNSDQEDDAKPKILKKDRKSNKANSDIERKFECPLCFKRFLTPSAMNGHVAKLHRTTLGNKYICHLCGAPGSSRSSLKRHLVRTHKVSQVEHPELLTKKCSHCNEGFAALSFLYAHVRLEHVDKVPNYYECKFCPALIRSKASFLRHVRRAHPGKEDLCTAVEMCSVCGDPFTNLHLLQKHKKEMHPELKKHQCNLCDAIFKYPSMLSRHKLSHENPAKYREFLEKRKIIYNCDRCNRKFNSKVRLTTHIRKLHTNPPEERIYSCRLCGLTFLSAKLNNKHYRRVHRPERQKIHCGKCNITFKTREECDIHRALHPATCHICQKQFLRRDSLREHLLIHSAPRHQCPHCSKKFTQRSNLKRHIRVHTGEKPYKCDYCHRGFSDKSACNSHMRVHTGYERSVCTICGVSFSKKQRLNYHMRIHSGQGLLHCPLCQRPCTSSYSFRKHVESHQIFLTKTLRTMNLLPTCPDFVANALQSLIQVTLDQTGHKTRDTRPLINSLNQSQRDPLELNTESCPSNSNHSVDDVRENNILCETGDGSPGSTKADPRMDNVKTEPEIDSTNTGSSVAPLSYYGSLLEECSGTLEQCSPNSNQDSADKIAESNLVNLFQSVIEKETRRIACLKKRIRKTKTSNDDDSVYAADIDDDDDDSYEGSIAQCLEIVMSEDEDEYDNDTTLHSNDEMEEQESSDHDASRTYMNEKFDDTDIFGVRLKKEPVEHDSSVIEFSKTNSKVIADISEENSSLHSHKIKRDIYCEEFLTNDTCAGNNRATDITQRQIGNNDRQSKVLTGQRELDSPTVSNSRTVSHIVSELRKSKSLSLCLQTSSAADASKRFESPDNQSSILKIPKLKISRSQNEFVVKLMKDSS